MTAVDPDLVSLIEAAANAAIQRALLQTVTPVYRHGVVIDVDLNAYIHSVQMDGDANPIPCHDITQLSPNAGDRVTVLFAPPHQAMIVGLPVHDTWHVVGDPGEVPFNTGWGHDASTVALDVNGEGFVSFRHWGHFVELRGFANRSSGSSSVVFILPEGYRPRNLLKIAGAGALAAYTFIQVQQTGEVQAGSGGQLLLDGAYFSVA